MECPEERTEGRKAAERPFPNYVGVTSAQRANDAIDDYGIIRLEIFFLDEHNILVEVE